MQRNFNHALNRLLLLYRGFIGPIPSPEKWIFIVGCYNSGTTLLHRILANHQDIGSLPVEGQTCTNQFVSPKELGIPRLWAIKSDRFHLVENSTPGDIARKVKRQWGHNFNRVNRPILIEKSITNAARTRWLNQYFENAHFIAVVRNGYAVAEGIHRKAGHSLSLAAKQWSISNQIMIDDLEMVPRKMMLKYEDFTNSPEESLKNIAEFIGVDDIFQQDKVNEKSWEIHGVSSQIRNMNQESFDRLSSEDKNLIESEAMDMLRQLGYYENNVSS